MAQYYEMMITFIITTNFCNVKKMNCALMHIISNHYGRKCVSNLLQLEPWNDVFNVISDIMVHWYEMINTFVITL